MNGPEAVLASAVQPAWPRIALVTPVFNSGKYIEATIRSVLAQEYPNLDYFIVDGGSTDETLDIVRKYESQISGWISEPDKGMYEALNKGFARTSGEIMGWISATDMLQLGGLSVAGSVFRDLPEVEWITGRPTVLDELGMTVRVYPSVRWSRYRFLAGANRYIQQESTFWRRSLWEKAGGYLDASRHMASDFELWVRFFRHAQLYSVDALIGSFRSHATSLGFQRAEECHGIQDEIIEGEINSRTGYRLVKLLRHISRRVKVIPRIEGLWQRMVINNVHRAFYRVPGPDWPPMIEYRLWAEPHRWVLRRK